MNRLTIALGAAGALFLLAGCASSPLDAPGCSVNPAVTAGCPGSDSATQAAPTPTADGGATSLQNLILGAGPQWSKADAAQGDPDTETVNTASCLATSVGNYTCNATYTITGSKLGSDGTYSVTIAGTCSAAYCQTQVSGTPVKSS
jgi:hypothetical protein